MAQLVDALILQVSHDLGQPHGLPHRQALALLRGLLAGYLHLPGGQVALFSR